MFPLTGQWNKISDRQEERWVDVLVLGFSTATFNTSIRPVAIVEERDGTLRYVELKFIRITDQ